MSVFLENFKWSMLIAIIGIFLGYYLGGVQGMVIVALLSIMEISLSFDNAVVNAKVLDRMSEGWQTAFLTVGMLIAVFGMRFAFPIIVVSLSAGMGLMESFHLGVDNPSQYASVLKENMHIINGFGGTFLFMIFVKFIFDQEKEVHWIKVVEEKLSSLGKLEGLEITITLLFVLIASKYLPEAKQFGFLFASIAGLTTYLAVNIISDLLANMEGSMLDANDMKKLTGRAGLGLFIYLEVLDASFSFDGVIGAFALSNNFFVITIGLTVGAMFVRSLTIFLVKKGTLNEYIYLEHGAHYAIGVLGILMFLHLFFHIPELVTSLMGVGFIVVSFMSSLSHNKRVLKEEMENDNENNQKGDVVNE